jgi:hypothetical protein
MEVVRRLFGRQQAPPPERVVEPTGTNDSGPCSCCGDHSRCVWGFVHHGDAGEAAYFVHWTLRRVELDLTTFEIIPDLAEPDPSKFVALENRPLAERMP